MNRLALTIQQKKKIQVFLEQKMKEKIENYSRETTSMPFLSRLIQNNEVVASYSLLTSLATTLGQSIYENLGVMIAEHDAQETSRQMKMGGGLSVDRNNVINNIMRELRNGTRKTNKKKETLEILAAPNKNAKFQKEGNVADFYMKRNDEEYYFEIKTVKPNIDIFTASKRKMLEWIARKDKPIKSIVALPYNPYAPKPYERFTEQNLFDRNEELVIGKEFWDFLGGKNTYEDLLELFDITGKKFKSQLQEMIGRAGSRADVY